MTSSPPASRGRSKSQQKRQDILQAASDIFMGSGFEGASMDQIAVAAGVSKQTVYSHFGSKEELFTAIIEHKCLSHDITDDLFDLDKPVAVVLKAFIGDLTTLLNSEDAICLYRVCVASAEHRSRVAELFWDAGPQRVRDKLCHYLQQQRELDIDNPAFAAQHLIGLIKGETTLRRELGLPHEHLLDRQPDYLDSVLRVFLKAYAK